MKLAVFGAKKYDQDSFRQANSSHLHEITFLEPGLSPETVRLADGFEAICVFVNDAVDRTILEALAQGGTRLIALRCAGHNNVDLLATQNLGIRVVRVPAYSPHAIAEHTIGMILTLNRKLHRAYNRVREGNFALEGLLGFDLHRKTAGIVGTGQIGTIVARLLHGFGCRLLAYDVEEVGECLSLEVEYVPLDQLLSESDIITLHCPLLPETKHLISCPALSKVKPGVMLINTSRGAIIDTPAVIEALKDGRIGHLGLDVYEEEAGIFFEDGSDHALADDVLARLLTFPNVLVTGHQAFFTKEALSAIAETTLENVTIYEAGGVLHNEVKAPTITETRG